MAQNPFIAVSILRCIAQYAHISKKYAIIKDINILRRGLSMAKTNYSYEKRGRELERQKKQEEKRQKKLDKKNANKKEEE